MSARVREKVKGSREFYVYLTVPRADCFKTAGKIESRDRRSSTKVGGKGTALALAEEANGLLSAARLQGVKVRARDILHQASIILRGRMQGASPNPGVVTVAEYGPSWLDTVSGSTHDKYEIVFRRHILPTFGSIPLNRIPKRMVREWLQGLERTHKSADRYFAIFQAMMSQAVRDEEVRHHPFPSIRSIRAVKRQQKAEARCLSRKELAELIGALRRLFPDFGRRGMFEFQAVTGVRIGELLGLRWADIDFEEGTARIQRQRYKGKIQPTKGRKRRKVIIGRLVLDDLRRLRVRHRKAALAAGRKPSPYVFLSKDGRPFRWDESPRKVTLKPALIAAGILPVDTGLREAGLGSHTLRHTWASHRLAENVPVAKVSKALGHATPAVTMGIYAHVIPDETDEQLRVDLDAI